LTGEASLDWVRAAGPSILTEEFAGIAQLLPLRAATVGDAVGAQATRLLHCTYSQRGGSLHFEFAVEDAQRHKMIETGAAEGSVLTAMNTVARRLDAAARPFSTANQEAVAAWGHDEFERAVTLDPDFGMAWLAWVQQLMQSGKRDEALAVADRALARTSLRSPLNIAQIQLASATLRNDQAARSAALSKVAELVPNDVGTMITLAESEQLQRRYSVAAEWYRRALALDPGNSSALNSLGYAEGEAGNLEAARKALEDYGKRPDQATNALDSLGEVYFMNGRFAEAEKYFLQATARDANFLGGAPLMKAAYARWLAGDLPGADSLMSRYRQYRESQNDTAVTWRRAVWLYATGRKDQALTVLATLPASQAAVAQRQRAVWNGEIRLPEDLARLKALYEGVNPAKDGFPRVIYAAALVRAGKTEDARALLKLWPLPESVGDPLVQTLLYPQLLQLRQSLKAN
jgi:Tfp pilus assembly protein PilF